MKYKILNDKRGMELRFFVIAIILFSGIFGLLTLAYHDGAEGYNAPNMTNPAIEARYNKLSESANLVGDLKDTTGGTGGLKLLSTAVTIFTATVGVLSAVLQSVTIIPTIFGSMAQDFGIPTPVFNLFFLIATLIITVYIVFAILNSIRR